MSGSLRLLLVGGAIVIVSAILALTWWNRDDSAEIEITDALVHRVEYGDFESTVTEPGDMESASNIEIRCDVKSKGRAGTTILEIVPEGTRVKKGDFLVQFDDSILRDELVAQKIQVANDRASVIQAESDLDTAKRALREYEDGIYEQERSLIEAEVAFATETVRRAEEYYRHSKRLSVRGYVTDSQLEADKYAVIKAAKDLELAKQKLEVFEKYTRERMVSELAAEIEKQEANLEAAEFTLQLSQQRQADLEEQIGNCRVTAPHEGMVIYANDNDRGDSSIVIEEGVLIRDGQVIIRLPDPAQMQVVTHVNDSKINLVKPGNSALIWLDTDPENPIQGEVGSIAGFPLPRRWYQAPIEYEVFVKVVEESDAVRPGLRAKVQIFVEQRHDVLQVPVSSIVREQDDYYVIVWSEAGLQGRRVEIGPNNDKFVVIENGLQEGEQVIIDGESYRDAVELVEERGT